MPRLIDILLCRSKLNSRRKKLRSLSQVRGLRSLNLSVAMEESSFEGKDLTSNSESVSYLNVNFMGKMNF